MLRRSRVAVAAVVASAFFGAGPGAAGAATTQTKNITAAVSLGDSYISGEAGRWQGNSIDDLGSRDGTDRAFTGTGYDLSRVYLPPADTDGCHRADVSEVRSASLPVDVRVNLACSGAVTQNIFRATSGGVGSGNATPIATSGTATGGARRL